MDRRKWQSLQKYNNYFKLDETFIKYRQARVGLAHRGFRTKIEGLEVFLSKF